MESYLTTVNHDIKGLKKIILEGKSFPNFSSVTVFSILRDACIILYEVNKVMRKDRLIIDDLPNIEIIKGIRHKVKTNQGFRNRELFIKLLDGHKSIYGSDIDNLGFFLDKDILMGTSLFPSFIFADTPLFNVHDRDTSINFSTIIGSIMQEIIEGINKPIHLETKPLKSLNVSEYNQKNIWDQRLFSEDISYNVFLTRLLLIQNELTTCIWLENHLDYKSNYLNFDKYILLRLSSVKLFEIMRNLLDIKNQLEHHWGNLNLAILDQLLAEYEELHMDEMKILRDMLHYNNNGINFYDHLMNRTVVDETYIDRLIKIIFNDYVYQIRDTISKCLNIQSYESMSDNEKISRRLNTLNYQLCDNKKG